MAATPEQDPPPLARIRAVAAELGLDADAIAVAAQAQMDQAEAWQHAARPSVPPSSRAVTEGGE